MVFFPSFLRCLEVRELDVTKDASSLGCTNSLSILGLGRREKGGNSSSSNHVYKRAIQIEGCNAELSRGYGI